MAVISRIVPKNPEVALFARKTMFLLKKIKGWHLRFKKLQKNRTAEISRRGDSLVSHTTSASIKNGHVLDSNPRPSASQTTKIRINLCAK